MTIVYYHSTIFADLASQKEATVTTSSQILLSREVAGHTSEPISSPQSTSTSAVSVFELDRHIMTLGEPARYKICAAKGTVEAAVQRGVGVEGRGLWPDGDQPKPLKRPRVPSYRSIDPPAEKASIFCSPTPGLCVDSREDSTEKNPAISKGKGKQRERGRTLERGTRLEDPLARATSRQRSHDAAIELDMRPIQKRISRSSTFFEDPADPRAKLEDQLLEPMPNTAMRGSISSFSEVLQRSLSDSETVTQTTTFRRNFSRANTSPFYLSTLDSFSNTRRPSDPFKKASNDRPPLYPLPTLPPESLAQILPNIDHLEYIAIKSSSLLLSSNGDVMPSRITLAMRPTAAARLPTEIIHQIFQNLDPVDYNSARHTCRSWFVNSLKPSLLEIMLRRGGWSNGILANLGTRNSSEAEIKINEEWLMSKRISRECALGPDWTGNGISEPKTDAAAGTSSSFKKTALVPTSEIDFTEVSVHFPRMKAPGIIFTVSSCGRFVMVANGCLIYIYELNRSHKPAHNIPETQAGSLKPVVSIICPRQVIACSMDTSSDRYAVAALLESRMGIVCDITTRNLGSGIRSNDKPDTIISAKIPDQSLRSINHEGYHGASFLDHISFNSSASHIPGSPSSTEAAFVFPGIAATGTDRDFCSPVILENRSEAWQESVPENHQKETSSARLGPRGSSEVHVKAQNAQGQESNLAYPRSKSGSNTLPVETGPRSIYRNLCSDDDPPRSVAICPQRRCVAFGCSAGIELHWVDALTGQDLNRWFPLTAPSDYLFFLPPRKSVDSAKKLRLISSAARPDERSTITERAFGGKLRPSPFWERWGTASGSQQASEEPSHGFLGSLRRESTRSGTGWRAFSDHYRAIPLSDGYHILFTDPATGLLSLGSDAPVGGPTKLLRKIWFKGPAGAGSPVVYTSGSDLNCGVRVVAAFGSGEEQSVWLFSVPSDVFAAGSESQSSVIGPTAWLGSSSPREIQRMDWVKWWRDDGMQEWLHHVENPQPGILPRSVWPIEIRGQEIGKCRGLVDLALDSGPDMTVWAFSKEGSAKVWCIDDGRQNGVKKKLVVRDGTIRECDGEGNVEMCDASPSPSPEVPDAAESFMEHSYASDISASGITPASFDGTTSLSTSTVFTTESTSLYPPVLECNTSDARFDADGDVLMEDLPGVERYVNGDDDEGDISVMSAHRRGEIFYHSSRWFGRSYRTRIAVNAVEGRDIVEELTGIARIDIEVR